MNLKFKTAKVAALEVYAKRFVVFVDEIAVVEVERCAVLLLGRETVSLPIAYRPGILIRLLGIYRGEAVNGEEGPRVDILILFAHLHDLIIIVKAGAVNVRRTDGQLQNVFAIALHFRLRLSVHRLRVQLVHIHHRCMCKRRLLLCGCLWLAAVGEAVERSAFIESALPVL